MQRLEARNVSLLLGFAGSGVAVGRTLTLMLEVENTGPAPFTFEAALHTYLTVADIDWVVPHQASGPGLELLPRITRAQTMDVLSSQANIAGYRAVIEAAEAFGRALPMMMTAAGTVPAAKVFVMGVGVAGLQAIATARRLGAKVSAYDVRPVVKEQVQSLGAKFVELPLDTKDAQDKGGYAKGQTEEFYRRQQALMAEVVAAADVVITTALVPGQKAPVLVTEEMVRSMRPGSVVVDLAAEQGGNCALTAPGEEVERNGIRILGPVDLPSTVAFHASEMYARIRQEMIEAIAETDDELMLLYLEGEELGVEELRTLTWVAITQPADLARNLELGRRMMAGELPSFVLEKRYITRSGKVVWVRNSTSVLDYRDGVPYQVIALVEDITERREAQSRVE